MYITPMDSDNENLWRQLESLEDEHTDKGDCTCPGCVMLNIPNPTLPLSDNDDNDDEEEVREPLQIEQAHKKKASLRG